MKQDMSKICNLNYETMWCKRDNEEISEEEFMQWYNEHCAKCEWMSEICMCGED